MIMYLMLVRLWSLRRMPDVEMESMVERTVEREDTKEVKKEVPKAVVDN
jgi:hypothetical protein